MVNHRLVTCFLVILTGLFLVIFQVEVQAFGVKTKRPKLHEYGNVIINNFSQQQKLPPVVFKHWLHRTKYTCRLCHVDIGFAMKAEATGITEADNNMGIYCGACHDGETAFGPKEMNGSGLIVSSCERCHSHGKDVKFKYEFYEFRKQFPPERFGNGIDWLKSEDRHLLHLEDHLEGTSIRRSKIQEPKEFDLSAKQPNMPDVIFSHQKHTVWNGCELCHPEIFGIKKDSVPYSMEEIFGGEYCGVCHGTVAFPNIDCQRCHTKPVI